jgi:hypothetical protein
MRRFLEFLWAHPLRAIGLTLGALGTVVVYFIDGLHLIELKPAPQIWQGLCAAVFLVSVIAVLYDLWNISNTVPPSGLSPDVTTSPPEPTNIYITSPRPLEFLEDKQSLGKISSYRVRGTLRQLPHGHEIWLLTEDHRGGVYPQGFREGVVQFDSQTGEWVGRVAATTEQVKIIAVVAPPTSQDFFKYYQMIGQKNNYEYERLPRVPPECTNMAWVQARCRLTG